MSTCLVPFNQLYLHSSGDVYPCAFVQNNPEFVLGNIQKATLKDIWNGEAAKKLRDDHLGTLPVTCDKNQSTFLCNKTSLRTHFTPDDLKLKRLDIMLDSACNLTCVMCTNIYDKNGGFKAPFFWESNDEIFTSIKEVELVGGEPLISPYFFKIVERVTKLNNQCEWRLTTNAHFPINEALTDAFKKMKLSRISVSLDSLKPEVFEQIRARSQFQLVYDNIFVLKKIIPTLQINMVVQDSNFEELISMCEWTKKNNFLFHPILLVHPEKHSLTNIPREKVREWILQTMKANELIKDREIFFLMKKTMNLMGLQKDLEVVDGYLRQLKLMEQMNG